MDKKLTDLAANVLHREREVADYQRNIDTYVHIMADLPQGAPPPEVQQLWATPAEKLPTDVPLEIVMQVADYQLRDRLAASIRAEMVQQNIARRAMLGVKRQIPEGDYEQAIQAAQALQAPAA